MAVPDTLQDALVVWVDHQLCTGDGLCVQLAPEVFEQDLDGVAYVRDGEGRMLTEQGARADVPADLVAEVVESAKGCPGCCIYVEDADGRQVAGPDV